MMDDHGPKPTGKPYRLHGVALEFAVVDEGSDVRR